MHPLLIVVFIDERHPTAYLHLLRRSRGRDHLCAEQALIEIAQVAAPATSSDKVQIGSWVTFTDEHGNEQRVQLVGEDQADAAQGLINWGSPLGRALLGARVGDEVLWLRPAGDLQVEIIAIKPA